MFAKPVKRNAAHALVWLTAITFALPATPAFACNCGTGAQASACNCCGRQGLTQAERARGGCATKQQRPCCYHGEHAISTCCKRGSSTAGASHGCSCASSCPCKSGHPAQPAESLPSEHDSPSKVIGTGSHAGLSALITLPAVRSLAARSVEPTALAGSLERCIFLSRFRL